MKKLGRTNKTNCTLIYYNFFGVVICSVLIIHLQYINKDVDSGWTNKQQ